MRDIDLHTINNIPFTLKNPFLKDEPIMKDPEDPPVLGDMEKQLGCVVMLFAISSFFLSIISISIMAVNIFVK